MTTEIARSLLIVVIAVLQVTVGVLQRKDRARRKMALAAGADPPIRSTPATKALTGLMVAALAAVVLLLVV